MKTHVKLLFKAISVMLALSLAVSLCACYVNPQKIWFFQFFGLGFGILFVLNLICLIFWTIRKSKIKYVHFLIIVVSCFYIGRFVQIRIPNKDKNCIKIITYNTHEFVNIHKNRTYSFDEIADFLIKENADIVCLQEYNIKAGQNTKFVKFMNNYKYLQQNGSEIVFSRFPMQKCSVVDVGATYGLCVKMHINGKTVNVYNNHLQSTLFNPDRKFTDARSIKRIILNLKKAFEKRAAEVDFISSHISQCSGYTIVCGDFNDTPISYTYNKMRGKLNDAFVKAGCGISNTYQKLFSFLRIDYIFASKNIKIKHYKVAYEVKCSDHYPVIVKFDL